MSLPGCLTGFYPDPCQKNCGGGISALLHSRWSLGGGIHIKDDRGGAYFRGACMVPCGVLGDISLILG